MNSRPRLEPWGGMINRVRRMENGIHGGRSHWSACVDANDNSLNLIWGADEIAKAIKVTRRRAFYLLENGHIPARKVGGKWCADLETLRDHFRRMHLGEAA